MAERPEVEDPAWFESGAHSDRFGTVRARLRKLVRGSARAVRPLVGERVFESLYALGRVGYLPRIDAPETFVEKLLWLRRYYRDPRMPALADKLELRTYVSEVAPECRTPEVFTVSDSAENFDFDSLPERAVIKATHGSGLVAFWSPTSDRHALRALMRRWLRRRHHDHANEWLYAEVTPRVFAEADLSDVHGRPPPDFKLFAFGGEVGYVQVLDGRGEALHARFFDRAWHQVPAFRRSSPGGPPSPPTSERPPRPPELARMIDAAERLARPFPFVRVDCYLHRGDVYVGELTFFPASGHPEFYPPSFDRELSTRLVLPEAASPFVRRGP